jgi:hypothetical protein
MIWLREYVPDKTSLKINVWSRRPTRAAVKGVPKLPPVPN